MFIAALPSSALAHHTATPRIRRLAALLALATAGLLTAAPACQGLWCGTGALNEDSCGA